MIEASGGRDLAPASPHLSGHLDIPAHPVLSSLTMGRGKIASRTLLQPAQRQKQSPMNLLALKTDLWNLKGVI